MIRIRIIIWCQNDIWVWLWYRWKKSGCLLKYSELTMGSIRLKLSSKTKHKFWTYTFCILYIYIYWSLKCLDICSDLLYPHLWISYNYFTAGCQFASSTPFWQQHFTKYYNLVKPSLVSDLMIFTFLDRHFWNPG